MNDGSTGMQYTPRPPVHPWLRAAIPERSMRRADPATVMCTNSAIARMLAGQRVVMLTSSRAPYTTGATINALVSA
ncbi:hypothetical protein TPA0908_33240 [Micromonospora sp. AKA38]|nr:hypothetical protein TPA0908_33240 [Micromonospora sp. AKA38]